MPDIRIIICSKMPFLASYFLLGKTTIAIKKLSYSVIRSLVGTK